MSLTKIGSIGINTGIQFAGVTTIATLNGSDAVLSVGGTVNFVSDVSIGGTVSIAGTLTYEDVTNIDAVGLITARNGVVVGSGITLSKDGDGFFTGIVTATTFSGAFTGDGTSLTGVASTDNIKTNTNATFLQNINVSGSTTTGSLVSSGAVSGTTGTFSGAVSGTTGTFSSNLAVSGASNTLGNTTINGAGGAGGVALTVDYSGTDVFKVSNGGKITITGNLDMQDDDKILLGTDDDVQIYHTGSNAIIDNSTGMLQLRTDSFRLYNQAGSENMIDGTANGAVNIYFDNAEKFKTTKHGTVTTGISTASEFAAVSYVKDNLLDNGDYNIWQRGNSLTNRGNDDPLCDRWKQHSTDSNFTGKSSVENHALTSTEEPYLEGHRSSCKIDCTTTDTPAGNESISFVQRIEAFNMSRFALGTSSARPMVASFWVKGAATGTYSFFMKIITQSTQRIYNKTFSVTTSWQKITIPIPAGTTGVLTTSKTGYGAEIGVVLCANIDSGGATDGTWQNWTMSADHYAVSGQKNFFDSTSNDIEFAGFQLVEGTSIGRFEFSNIGLQLQRCHRHLYTTHALGAGVWNGTTSFFCHVTPAQPMRVAPTLSMNSGVYTNINIEHNDTYGVTGATNPSGGHAYPNMNAAYGTAYGYHNLVIAFDVSYTATTGDGGFVMCDANSDFFILSAEM